MKKYKVRRNGLCYVLSGNCACGRYYRCFTVVFPFQLDMVESTECSLGISLLIKLVCLICSPKKRTYIKSARSVLHRSEICCPSLILTS